MKKLTPRTALGGGGTLDRSNPKFNIGCLKIDA